MLLDVCSPKLVLFRVSGARPTLNQPSFLSNSVAVRQAPFTQIESPTLQSPRIGAASRNVKVKPSEES
jgi:hypothetical protein